MTLTDLIALIAIFVAVLSALYSRWGVNEAKKANRIALQFERVEIYKEVIAFSESFRGFFTVPSAERLEQFRQKAVNLSEIYFSEKIHSQLNLIYSLCKDSELYLSVLEDNDDEDLPTESEVKKQYKSVLKHLYPVIEDMKNELKINA